MSRTRKNHKIKKDITEVWQDNTTTRVRFVSLKVRQTRGNDCFLFSRVGYDKVMSLKCLLIESPSFLFNLHEFVFEVFIQGDNLDVCAPLSSYAD